MTVFTGTIPTIASGDTTTVPTNLATYRDALKGAADAWTAYTPTWTATSVNPAIGNGSFTGSAYMRVNKLVTFRIVLNYGSTTSGGTGQWLLALPVTPINAGRPSFIADMLDTGVNNYTGRLVITAGSITAQLLTAGTSAGGPDRAVSATVPFTFGTGDQLTITGTYEAA